MIPFIEKFRNIGFKLTPQRIAILEYLEGNRNHPSAEEIYKEVSQRFPTISVATVYNTLESLRQLGGVTELKLDPVKKRFDPNTEPHHHLICVRCKRVLDIHERYGASAAIPNSEGFEILGSHIEFHGICPSCKSRKSAGEKREQPVSA